MVEQTPAAPAPFPAADLSLLVPPTSSIHVHPPGEKGKLKLPQIREVTGILVSAEVVELQAGDFVLITVQDVANELITVSSSPAYWSRVGRTFQEDMCVQIKYEQRLAGKTGYEDATGAMVAHTGDGNNLAGIKRFAKSAFDRMVLNGDSDDLIAKVMDVQIESQTAVATLLGHLYGGRR